MSRKITEQACHALMNGNDFRKDNTVIANGCMYLFGNCIASLNNAKHLTINMQGWNTVTTRERLNGLPNVRLSSRNYTPILNGQEISSSGWYEILPNGKIKELK